MPKMHAAALIAQIEAHGFKSRSVEVGTEGDYLPADVDWNNKDIQHLNHVHAWANDVTAIVLEDLQATVSFQKVLGITCPVVIVHYDAQPDHQAHFFTLGPYTFVTDIEFIRVSPTRTRVITTYTVLAKRVAMLAFPVIRWLLRRNQVQLMSEDVPMRERRGVLRSWGYTFKGDEGETRDIRDSINIHRDNVVPPPPDGSEAPGFDAVEVPVDSIGEGSWTMVGRDDHLGVKLTRDGDRILAFGRMCPHEGADLDEIDCVDDQLKCPWHGRKLAPLAVIDLDGSEREATSGEHRITREGDNLVISVDPSGSDSLRSAASP
ncbi:MAG: Rieske 2Fe-2S domain-containing protein, partial [Actinomycetota bacterium]